MENLRRRPDRFIDIKLNNLRISLRFLIYNVLRTESERLIATYPENARNVIRNSGFGINIRLNQDNYMRGVQQNLRQRIRARIAQGINIIPFQYDYELFWAFTDDFDNDNKILILHHARNLHSYLQNFLFNVFNYGTNELRLRFDTYDSRCFIGLYEAPRNDVRDPINNPVIDVVHNNNSFLRFSNYTPRGYINNTEVFYNTYVDRFLLQVNNLNPEFNLQDAENELARYQDSLIIVSPGLNIETFNLLLNTPSEELVRAIYVSWTTRIGFQVNGSFYRDSWLRNDNISNLEEDNNEDLVNRNSHLWQPLLRFNFSRPLPDDVRITNLVRTLRNQNE